MRFRKVGRFRRIRTKRTNMEDSAKPQKCQRKVPNSRVLTARFNILTPLDACINFLCKPVFGLSCPIRSER